MIAVRANGGNLLWKAQSFLAPEEAVSASIKFHQVSWTSNFHPLDEGATSGKVS